MAEEDDSWIYDSVVGFLNSPIWMVPIESFVDQHCLVFDGGVEDSPEYSKIHTKYKQLVEELLECFTKDLHITSQQFIAGCQKGRAATGSYTQGMFEYVFASVNYDLFKSIMVRHNAALSLQALQMIRGGTTEGAADLEAAVMKYSEQEYATHRQEFDIHSVKEMADLEAALVKSRLDCETLLKDIEKDKYTLCESMETKGVQQASQSAQPEEPQQESLYPEIPSFDNESAPLVEPMPVPPNTCASTAPMPDPLIATTDTAESEAPNSAAVKSSVEPLPAIKITAQAGNDAAQKWLDEAKAETSTAEIASVPQTQTLDERKRYWEQRKQEILETKKALALHKLSAHGESSMRPTSARVAQRVIEAQPSEVKPESKPAMSQALAAALRREVVNKP